MKTLFFTLLMSLIIEQVSFGSDDVFSEKDLIKFAQDVLQRKRNYHFEDLRTAIHNQSFNINNRIFLP